MKNRLCWQVCLVAWLVAASAAAQEPDDPIGVLPELEIEAERVADPRPAPAPDRTPPAFDPWDLTNSYPRLSDIEFEPADSALRSSRTIFDDPRHTTVVDSIGLQERMPMTMLDALEREVGVLVQRTGAGQASPFIRGLTGPQTLILIDGIRVNNSTFRLGPNQYFGTIDPGMIDRIEVVRGPQSVLWGSDAIGGVINVITRSGEAGSCCNYMEGQFIQRFRTADSASYSRANAEGSVGSLGFFGGGSYLNVRDLDRGGGLGRQPFTNYSQYAGDIKFDYLLNDDQMLTFALQHFEQMDVPRTDRFPAEFRIFTPQQRDLGYLRWQGLLDNALFDTFVVTGSFQRQKEGSVLRRPPASPVTDFSEFDVHTTGANLLLAKDLDRWGIWTTGVDWYHDDVNARANRLNANTGQVTARPPQFPPDSFYQSLGTFLQWDALLTQRLSVVSGVRFSHIEAGATVALFDPTAPGFPNVPPTPTRIDPTFQDWTASVGLTYELDPVLHLVGSVSEGFRAPGLDELTSFSTNVNEGVDLPTIGLDPERSVNYEVGLKLNHERLRGQAFVFWTDLEGLIDRVLAATGPFDPADPTDVVNFFQRRNIGRAHIQGVELAGEYLVTPEWSLYGNFWNTFGQNVTDDEPVSRIPPTQGIVGFRWRDRCHRNWFDVYGWLVRRQDRLSTRDMRDTRIPSGGTPGYGTLNLRAGRQLTRSSLATLTLENITDRAYRVHGSGVDGPGFNVHCGLELTY